MSDMYRDRSDGAAARREELLRRRRAELATMPHAVRRVVVGRASRITSTAVATLLGVGLLAMALSPGAAEAFSRVLPDGRPAPLATMLTAAWLAGLLAWAWSRARGEHRFVVAMSRHVLPSDDLDHDVERLDHERPDAIARAIANQLEVRSAAWPIAAAGVVLPATALWLLHAVRARGWAVSNFEDALTAHAGALALAGLLGAAGAIAVTRRAMRQAIVAPIAGATGVVLLGAAALAFATGHVALGWPLAGLATPALVLGAVAWRLGRERALLAIADPAAGSELFTLRGLLRAVRAALARQRAALATVRRRTWAILAGAVLIPSLAVASSALWSSSARAPRARGESHQQAALADSAAPAVDEASADEAVAAPPRVDPSVSLARHGDRLEITAVLDDRGEAVVPLVPQLRALPAGWQATLELELTGRQLSLLDEASRQLGVGPASSRAQRVFEKILVLRACDGPVPLDAHLIDRSSPGARITLSAHPRLELADCPAR